MTDDNLLLESGDRSDRRRPRTDRSRVAVLGVLSVEPMTGYEIRRNIAQTLGHFWHESFGQIYPTLTKLQRDGLVRGDPNERGRGRRWAITEAELRVLRHELDGLGPLPPPRNTLLLQLFFGRQLGPARCLDLVAEARAEVEARLVEFDEMVTAIEHETGYEADRPYWLMTLAQGRTLSTAFLDWADGTMDVLRSLEGHRAESR